MKLLYLVSQLQKRPTQKRPFSYFIYRRFSEYNMERRVRKLSIHKFVPTIRTEKFLRELTYPLTWGVGVGTMVQKSRGGKGFEPVRLFHIISKQFL
jgi:hypothetical protein